MPMEPNATTEFHPPSWRFHVSIRESMGIVAMSALACVWPGLIPTEFLVVAAWATAKSDIQEAKDRLKSLGWIIAAVYFWPVANLGLVPILNPAAAATWQREWSPFVPITPAAFPAFVLQIITGFADSIRSMIPSNWINVVSYAILSLMTAAEILVLIELAGRTRTRRAIACSIGFVNSGLGTLLLTVFSNG